MDTATLTKLGIAVAIAYGVFHFSKNQAVKGAALGVLGTVVAKQVPYVKDALA
jgi:hypothetical protein